MGRRPCCEKIGLKRGAWTVEEDNKLTNFILNNGIVCWRRLPKLAGLLRCGKSCRLRWVNYLRPDVKRGEFTDEEDDQIIQLHSRFGNKWSKIASHFPGRTDNEIKNHWNTRIRKKFKRLGLDPWTHKPIEQNQIHKKNSFEQNSSIKNKLKNKLENEHQERDLGHDENNAGKSELSPNSENKGGMVDDDDARNEASMSIDYDYEMLWKNLEMVAIDNELKDFDPSIENDQQNKATFLDGELQQWLNQLESRLFSDCPNDFHEISSVQDY